MLFSYYRDQWTFSVRVYTVIVSIFVSYKYPIKSAILSTVNTVSWHWTWPMSYNSCLGFDLLLGAQ